MDMEAWRCDWAYPFGLTSAFYDRNKPGRGPGLLAAKETIPVPHSTTTMAVCEKHNHAPPVEWCTCGVHAVTDLTEMISFAEVLDRSTAKQPEGVFPALTKVLLVDALPGAHRDIPVGMSYARHGMWGANGDPASTFRARMLVITGPILTTSRTLVAPLARRYQCKVGYVPGSLADTIRKITGTQQ